MRFRGNVVQGLGIGKKLGYPTANLDCGNVACPMAGVYAAKVVLDKLEHYSSSKVEKYNAVAVVGAREHEGKLLIEVLLFDFQGDLYGKEIEVEVLDKISDIQAFENDKALIKKIEEDVKMVRNWFASRTIIR